MIKKQATGSSMSSITGTVETPAGEGRRCLVVVGSAKAYSFIVQILVTLISNRTLFMDRAKDQQTIEAIHLALQGKKC